MLMHKYKKLKHAKRKTTMASLTVEAEPTTAAEAVADGEAETALTEEETEKAYCPACDSRVVMRERCASDARVMRE